MPEQTETGDVVGRRFQHQAQPFAVEHDVEPAVTMLVGAGILGGGLAREKVVPVVEARYLVSVWGGGPGVEHELLGRIVNLLAPARAIPEEYLGDGLRLARPRPSLALSPDDTTSATQLWSALGIPPRAGVQLRVESPMGVPVALPAADPPRSMRLVSSQRTRPAAYSRRRRVFGRTEPSAAGGRVVSPRGSAIIQASGRYNVEAAHDDPIDVQATEAPVDVEATEERADG